MSDSATTSPSDIFRLTDESSIRLAASSPGPLMTLAPPPFPSVLRVFADDGTELLRIERDGTVVAAYPGAEEPAAKRFYEALQFYGQSLFHRVKELEERLAKYEPVQPVAQ